MIEFSKIQSEQLISEIEVAFSDVQYPGDDKLVYDNSGYHLECQKIKKDFKGNDWRTMQLDMLRYHAESLFFLTPEAYHFYLPAYLLVSIRSYREADIIPNTIVYSLTAPHEQGLRMEKFTNRINNFNQNQKLVIIKFLELLRTKITGVTSLKEIDAALEVFLET